MKTVRKLTLKKEALFDLSTEDLRDVAGGAITPACPTGHNSCLSCLVNPCDPTRTVTNTVRDLLSRMINPCP
jgi:hypothetical protein